jgi:signal peptidase I
MKKMRRASFTVDQNSMFPTLKHRDKLIAFQKNHSNPLKRGDIVIFNGKAALTEKMVKRVVGLPEETISISAGVCRINGDPLRKPEYRFDSLYKHGPIVIPPKHYFLIGDNVKDSEDSRDFGPVPVEDITHKAIAVYWPPYHFTILV